VHKTPKPAPFVLLSTHHGTMIINRNDYHLVGDNQAYGVGHQLMNTSCYDPSDVNLILSLLQIRRQHFGDGVFALDCGANVGVHTLEWAGGMQGWGEVLAFEAQERIFYALAGNVVINNCLNASVKFAAVGAEVGEIEIPEPDYLSPGSFGSFELTQKASNENIGQEINYQAAGKKISQITLDSLELERVDLLKIDVEGMEEDVLIGAFDLIAQHKPVMFIEFIKSDSEKLSQILSSAGYTVFYMPMNLLAVHQDDPTLAHLESKDGRFYIN
jgi:FkbM family methyltransferase